VHVHHAHLTMEKMDLNIPILIYNKMHYNTVKMYLTDRETCINFKIERKSMNTLNSLHTELKFKLHERYIDLKEKTILGSNSVFQTCFPILQTDLCRYYFINIFMSTDLNEDQSRFIAQNQMIVTDTLIMLG
jgi:hypothetical protein